jgi:hypothetical protein
MLAAVFSAYRSENKSRPDSSATSDKQPDRP